MLELIKIVYLLNKVLLHDSEKREAFASKILSTKHLIKDSNDFWRLECHSTIESLRYLADPPEYRKRTPIEQLLFRIRAMNYNSIPAARFLFPKSEIIKNGSPEDTSNIDYRMSLKI